MEVDYGYGDGSPDYGYGDATPDSDIHQLRQQQQAAAEMYGYGDDAAADMGYGDARPDSDPVPEPTRHQHQHQHQQHQHRERRNHNNHHHQHSNNQNHNHSKSNQNSHSLSMLMAKDQDPPAAAAGGGGGGGGAAADKPKKKRGRRLSMFAFAGEDNEETMEQFNEQKKQQQQQQQQQQQHSHQQSHRKNNKMSSDHSNYSRGSYSAKVHSGGLRRTLSDDNSYGGESNAPSSNNNNSNNNKKTGLGGFFAGGGSGGGTEVNGASNQPKRRGRRLSMIAFAGGQENEDQQHPTPTQQNDEIGSPFGNTPTHSADSSIHTAKSNYQQQQHGGGGGRFSDDMSTNTNNAPAPAPAAANPPRRGIRRTTSEAVIGTSGHRASGSKYANIQLPAEFLADAAANRPVTRSTNVHQPHQHRHSDTGYYTASSSRKAAAAAAAAATTDQQQPSHRDRGGRPRMQRRSSFGGSSSPGTGAAAAAAGGADAAGESAIKTHSPRRNSGGSTPALVHRRDGRHMPQAPALGGIPEQKPLLSRGKSVQANIANMNQSHHKMAEQRQQMQSASYHGTSSSQSATQPQSSQQQAQRSGAATPPPITPRTKKRSMSGGHVAPSMSSKLSSNNSSSGMAMPPSLSTNTNSSNRQGVGLGGLGGGGSGGGGGLDSGSQHSVRSYTPGSRQLGTRNSSGATSDAGALPKIRSDISEQDAMMLNGGVNNSSSNSTATGKDLELQKYMASMDGGTGGSSFGSPSHSLATSSLSTASTSSAQPSSSSSVMQLYRKEAAAIVREAAALSAAGFEPNDNNMSLLYILARCCEWEAVLEELKLNPRDAKVVSEKDGTTALHLAVMSRTNPNLRDGKTGEPAPMHVIEALVKACPEAAIIRCSKKRYTPLAYACLVADQAYNMEDCSKIVQILLKYAAHCPFVFTDDGFSALDVHILSYSQFHKHKEEVFSGARTSTVVLRTLLQAEPSLADARVYRNKIRGPLELLYRCNIDEFKEAVEEETADASDVGSVATTFTKSKQESVLSDWWAWKWALMLLKFASQSAGQEIVPFSAVQAAARLVGCPLPILALCVSSYPNQVQDRDPTGDIYNLPVHEVCSWRADSENIGGDPFIATRKFKAIRLLLETFPQGARMTNNCGETALQLAVETCTPWHGGLELLVQACPKALRFPRKLRITDNGLSLAVANHSAIDSLATCDSDEPDPLEALENMYPFMVAAVLGGVSRNKLRPPVSFSDEMAQEHYDNLERKSLQAVRAVYGLLRARPEVLQKYRKFAQANPL